DEVAGGVLSDDYTKVASAGVGGDQIAGWRTRSSCQTADHGIRDATIEIQANVWVTQSDCPSYIRANEVALHCVVSSARQINAAAVTGNDIAGGNGGATNESVRAVSSNPYAVFERQRASNIGADQIALYRVAGAIPQPNADADIS